jgi:hypothetical protein
MKRNLLIFIGGSDAQNGDYSNVLRLAQRGGTANWSSLKTARLGDRVLIYIRQPPGALVVKCEVLANPVKGGPDDYAYRVQVGKFELLPNQLNVRDLKQKFPNWDWLRFPRRGITVPKPIANRLWKLVHEKQSRLQIIISSFGYGSSLLEKMSRSNASEYWETPKHTQPGDTLLFYVEEPISSIVYAGKALSKTRPTRRKWYEARVGQIKKLNSPITLAELRDMFPDWAWLRHVNMFAYISPERAKALLARCNEEGVKPPLVNRRSGAGFGNAETNPLVEKAAVSKVTRLLRSRGFTVVSRERECIGYDLDARKGRKELHVEVKGVSGAGLQFPITAAEVKHAQADARFRLMVVTNARNGNAQVHEFTGSRLTRCFRLTPLSFMALKLE